MYEVAWWLFDLHGLFIIVYRLKQAAIEAKQNIYITVCLYKPLPIRKNCQIYDCSLRLLINGNNRYAVVACAHRGGTHEWEITGCWMAERRLYPWKNGSRNPRQWMTVINRDSIRGARTQTDPGDCQWLLETKMLLWSVTRERDLYPSTDLPLGPQKWIKGKVLYRDTHSGVGNVLRLLWGSASITEVYSERHQSSLLYHRLPVCWNNGFYMDAFQHQARWRVDWTYGYPSAPGPNTVRAEPSCLSRCYLTSLKARRKHFHSLGNNMKCGT